MNRAITLTAALWMACFLGTAISQVLPSDVDLRAAYCMEVLNLEIQAIEEIRQTTPRFLSELSGPNYQALTPAERDQLRNILTQNLADAPREQSNRQQTLQRIRLYIVPRISYLDSSSLLAAMTSAKADKTNYANKVQETATTCHPRCQSDTACLARCAGVVEITSRFEACRNPTWLPF